ncbi:MAG: hypothetical protein EOP88_13315 [Verrucomicrobiaceae bacterium]|nr:MAG: hypothetical protein EOP88_13315 [Verrucomicrobiaceae bacterium]
MKNLLLPGAALVVGIALGVLIDGRLRPDEKAREEEPVVTRSTRSRHGPAGAQAAGARREAGDAALGIFLNGGTVSQLSAEEAYHLLDPDWKMSDDAVENARSQYQFALIGPKLSDAVLEEVIARGMKDGVKTPRLYQLFGIYASRDWDRAMAWAADKPDREALKEHGMFALAKSDPARGAEVYQKELLAGWADSDHYSAATTLARYKIGQGCDAFFKFYDSLPASKTAFMVPYVADSMRAEDMPAFVAEVGKRVAAGTLDRSLLQSVMLKLCVENPEAASPWIDSHEAGPQRAAAGFNVALALDKAGKRDEALSFMKTAVTGEPGKEKEFVASFGTPLLSAHPDLLEPLVDMLPPGVELTNEDVKNWVRPDPHNFEKIRRVSNLLSEDERSGYLEREATSLTRWFDGMNDGTDSGQGDDENLNANDFKILSGKLDSLHLTGHAAEKARTALENARKRAVGK